jgi:glycosyltransferase involved in cell wall biosynthesis
VRHVLAANVFFAPQTYGGATVVAEEVAKALRRRGGYRVSAVSTCQRPELAPYTFLKSECAGIDSYQINLPANRPGHLSWHDPKVTERMLELLQALAPDIVHAHCLQELGTGILDAAKMLNIPFVLSTHDYWWLCARQFMVKPDGTPCGQMPVRIDQCRGCLPSSAALELRQRHLHDIAEAAAYVTFPSRYAMSLSQASGFATGKGELWENGVQLPGPCFFQQQAARRSRDARVTFGFLGGPSQMKGWPLLRDAFGMIDRDDFRVLLADGSADGSWWSDITFRSLPGDWRIARRFSQSEIDSFYAGVDVLLFPSQWNETFGLAIREAQARGIAVIQTDGGGMAEHERRAGTQLMPKEATPAELADCIRLAIEGGHAVQPIAPVRSFDEQAGQLHGLFDRVLG